LIDANPSLFDKTATKKEYGCEGFFVEAGFPAVLVHRQITYWFGLFTHQKVTFLWKGILQVPLQSDDSDAVAFVDTLKFA